MSETRSYYNSELHSFYKIGGGFGPLFIMRKKYRKQGITEEATIQDIIRDVAHLTGTTVTEADLMTRTVFDAIKMRLTRKEAVRITKFGTFHLMKRVGRVSHNFGDPNYLPTRYFPKFTFVKSFMHALRNLKIEDDECTQESTPD